MSIIDNAVYARGYRTENPQSLEETFDILKKCQGMAWIGLYRPELQETQAVADEFGLHPLAVEDAMQGHQRSKLQRYGDTLFLVLRPARYLDDVEKVDFGELHLFVGPNFVVTIRHAEMLDIGMVRRQLEADPARLAQGPQAVLHALLDEVINQYLPVLAGVQNDIDEIEDQLFETDNDVARRIYALSCEVIDLQRATQPLVPLLEALQAGAEKYGLEPEVQHGLRDVQDQVQLIVDTVNAFRALLQNALTVHAALVGQRQNEEMRKLSESSLRQNEEMRTLTESSLKQNEEVKKISSWAAILFGPTLVGTIYGMNFRVMPELEWAFGYPFSIALMVLIGLGLYASFKYRKWL
ncbi:magnesium and cobalt transport protein CorA [uncultured Arthrobacter sp.]|uniref:magnesium and cobalt transport protein CorA n=1 Tax=uncultured Arthrobacter sp. TaxID=114050 RepID=UPI0025EA52F7|nr:magnesium and cobalt transport protein CorA [uncultured Arthrobacter sp.]